MTILHYQLVIHGIENIKVVFGSRDRFEEQIWMYLSEFRGENNVVWIKGKYSVI